MEPKATNKHTLCGYAWGDVTTSLQRSIGTSDMLRSQRWAAELVCSEQGLGRLEAILFHAWALHCSGFPSWCKLWMTSIQQLRSYWAKSGGDTKSVRNTPAVRQLVAESVAYLVLATKKPLPTLPTSADCFREAEAMRTRIRSGGGSGDQFSTKKIFVPGIDGEDLRTIGNELEASIRTNQIQRTLFWMIWMFTLESQTDAPAAKERGPAQIPIKQRKSIVWFFVALLKELANECAFLSVDDRNGVFGLVETTWPKLGVKGRRDTLVAIAISIQEHFLKKLSLSLSLTPHLSQPDHSAIRSAVAGIDPIYSGIAEEARRFILEAPKIAGLAVDKPIKPVKITSHDKMALSFSLVGK